jgi:hypothetical protein
MAKVVEEKFAHVGIKWLANENLHRCTGQSLNLIAKTFLGALGQLSDEDYSSFNLLAMRTDDVMSNGSPSVQQASIATPLPKKPVKKKPRPLNEPTLETQRTMPVEPSEATEVTSVDYTDETIDDIVRQARGSTRLCAIQALRDLGAFILSSPDNRRRFGRAQEATHDPPLLPLSLPFTRWNYIYLMIERGLQLKLSLSAFAAAFAAAQREPAASPISPAHWEMCEFILPVLRILNTATNILLSNKVQRHSIFPTLYAVEETLRANNGKGLPTAFRKATTVGLVQLQRLRITEMENDVSLITLILDPHYRDKAMAELKIPPEKIAHVVDCLRLKYAEKQAELNRCPSASGDTSQEARSFPGDHSDLTSIYSFLKIPPLVSPIIDYTDSNEVDLYLSDLHEARPSEDIVKYWQVSRHNLLHHTHYINLTGLMALFVEDDTHKHLPCAWTFGSAVSLNCTIVALH